MKTSLASVLTAGFLLTGAGCAVTERPETAAMTVSSENEEPQPPPAIRAWMDRLTIAHEWDPVTGFIVARENIELPRAVATGRRLDEALRYSIESGRPLIVFATADRCAPCQQYRKDAINDARVVSLFASGDLLAAHVEVDREGEWADRHLGSRGIPVTYRLENGVVTARFPGQRSADDLLAWLEGGPR